MKKYPKLGQHVWIVECQNTKFRISEGNVTFAGQIESKKLVITDNGIIAEVNVCFTKYSTARTRAYLLTRLYNYEKKVVGSTGDFHTPRKYTMTAHKWVPIKLWKKISPLLPRRVLYSKKPAYDDRDILGAFLYSYYNGTPLSRLPEGFAPHRVTIYKRVRLWKKLGVWTQINELLLWHIDESTKDRCSHHADALWN